MPEHPNVWTDGGREDFFFIGSFEVAGAGSACDGLVWGTVKEYGDAGLERCRDFLPVPGVGAIALQAYRPCHLGNDNLNVARTVGRLLDKDSLVKPLPLVKDGGLIAFARYVIRTGVGIHLVSLRVQVMLDDVQQGRVPLLDKQDNAQVDNATDLGRRHQSEVVIDARRRLFGTRSHIIADLHRFKISIARVSVN